MKALPLLLAFAVSISLDGVAAGAEFTTASTEQLARLPKAERLPEEAASRLRGVGEKVFGIKWGD